MKWGGSGAKPANGAWPFTYPILVMHLTCLGHWHVYPMLPTLNQTKLYSGLHFVKRDKINIYAKM